MKQMCRFLKLQREASRGLWKYGMTKRLFRETGPPESKHREYD